ncbi:MAG TPA: PilT/PilU family type 4a pilus ATPase, partial [Polyangiaceae bacterium]
RMLTVEELIRNLARSEVTEIALMTGRLPCVKVDGAYKPVDETARSADAILKILTKLGGARYLDDLGAKAVQWTTRVDGVGTIAVSAVDRAGNVQARMVLLKKETAAAPPPAPPPMSAPAVSTVAAARKPPPPDDDGLGLDLELDTSAPTPIAPPKREAAPDISPPTPIVPYDLEAAPRAVAHPQTKAIEDASFDALVSAARADRVSDLHLISERPPLFRVAGDLVPRGPVLSVREVERMIATVVPERLRGELERDGAVDFAMQLNGGRLRVNATRQRTGYKLSIRLVSDQVPTLESLGLPPGIADATKHHQGLIVVTGPTGHGKTSTLAAIVDILNRGTTHHIITVEDPIEYVHPKAKAMMSQREVGTHTKRFASALKASLREDPDVIVVGELRDTETVQMALSASETGHLVLGTMNTPSAAKTIDRLIDLFPPADQGQVRMTLAVGLRLIVSQRLVPTTDGKLAVAAELLPGSIALGTLIRDNKTFQIPSLQQRGKAMGIIRLEDSLVDLVKGGRITVDTARAESPEYDKAAKGIS